jgi:ABC-type multidrug transport system ATPase subunit
MLRLDALSVSRGGRVVVRDVNVAFADGEVHGLVGRNGAGKTTLLDAIAQLIAPDGGALTLHGSRLASHDVAYVPSALTFLPLVTVREYLRAFNESRRRRNFRDVDIAEWCRTFDIPLDADAATLSAGTQQALALVAALALGRPILVADELFAALDTDRQTIAASALRAYARRGRQVIVTLHAGDLIPLACDRAYLLAEGQITQELPASPPPNLRALLAGPGLDGRARTAAHLASSI